MAMLNGNPPHSLNPQPRAGGQPVLPRRAAAERRNTDSPDTALIDSPILYTMVYLYTYNTSMSPFMQTIEMLYAFCETYPVFFLFQLLMYNSLL